MNNNNNNNNNNLKVYIYQPNTENGQVVEIANFIANSDNIWNFVEDLLSFYSKNLNDNNIYADVYELNIFPTYETAHWKYRIFVNKNKNVE